MYEFHSNPNEYFDTQKKHCASYIIPFIETVYPIPKGCRVLEIGCGSAGVLAAFLERDCTGAGIDILETSIDVARKKLAPYPDVSLLAKDIYLVDVEQELKGKFDIILLKDVIEHIHNQEKLIASLKNFLHPGGVVFFGFPPWQMPFGGHQQMCRSKLLSRMPYIHLLPMPLYKWLLKRFHEGVEGLAEIKQTGISIERFEKILKKTTCKIINRQFYFINPIYQYKFGIKCRKQSKLIAAIPYLRNFATTCVFYLGRF